MRYCLILLVCPFASGCVAYCYPSVMQTPTLVVKEPDVKAFRVTEDSTYCGMIVLSQGTRTIEEIQLTDGEIPLHRHAYFAYYVLVFPIATGNEHSEIVRLYRRGYDTVTIEPSSWIASLGKNTRINVSWNKAETLEARAKAIRHLYENHTSMIAMNRIKSDFIADEYLELANSPLAAGLDLVEVREGLQKLAHQFREGKTELDAVELDAGLCLPRASRVRDAREKRNELDYLQVLNNEQKSRDYHILPVYP